MNLEETYDRIAEDWHRDHSADEWWQIGINEFIERLPEGAKVLDVGCGSGVKAEYLIAHGCSVVGIDLSINMLKIARRGVPDGDFRHLSMLDVDKIPDTFDGVFAQASLLHILKYERFFSYFTMGELESYLSGTGTKVVWQSRNPHPNGKTVWLQIIGQK